MPRESCAIPKYGGSEIELGIGSADRATALLGPSELSWRFISGIKQEWIPRASFASWDSRPRLADGSGEGHGYLADDAWRRRANFLLQNGARLYLDGAHPEYSTPLCPPGGKEKLAHYKAADIILRDLVRRHRENGLDVYLVKNCYGFDNRHGQKQFSDMAPDELLGYAVSFAHHDNYLVRRDTSWDAIVRGLLYWLPLRQIFNGQGKIGRHNQRANGLPGCDFQISQRADFFGIPVGHDTMGPERPLVNTRDVPYADRTLYRRLHIIPSDHNMCETAYYLTVALTEICLMMIEDGCMNIYEFADPVKAFWQISRDPALQQAVSLSGSESRAPLDLLEEEVARMGEYLVLYGIRNPEYHEAVVLALEIIGKLRQEPEECFGELDWITKKFILDAELARGKISSLYSYAAIQIDLGYSKLGPDGIFFRPGIQEYHRRIITDRDIFAAACAPPLTRSELHVAVMQLFSGFIVQWHWSKITVWVVEENAEYEIDLANPRINKTEYASLIAAADRFEFLRRAYEAGIAKKYKRRYAQSVRPWRPWAPIYPEDE
jgi:Pup amidohydrolase